MTRGQHPDPALLAQAWGESIGAGTEFSRSATKPASDFLLWLEAELKGEQALQPLFDSRALDNIESGIDKLTQELQREREAAFKVANGYQIQIGGNVTNSNIIVGDNNTVNQYFYSGDFVSLNEYYIPPDGVFQRVRVDEFVGRDWLTAKVDAFLSDPNRKSGAFLLIGDAGVGKTSFMAHLVKERRYLHLFAEQAPGQAMLQRAMQSLGSQLVTRYQIDPYKDRDTLNALSVFPDFLERILRLAASTLTEGEKIVIVCDALDEAGVFADHFVFGLPKELPDGVYFILSQRPVNVKLPNFEPVIEKLEAQGEGNLQDIGAYLSAVAKRPEVAGQIRSKEYSEDFFIQTLKEKSQGVWMYLHYIIKEIESGARAPLDLAHLPTGLVGYYAEYWDTWRTGKRGKGEEAWDELYTSLLTTLAVAQEAITVKTLIQWADVTVTPREVTRLLTEHWRAFITEKEKDGQKAYTPYHLSFKDFITGRVDTDKLPLAQANLVKDLAAQSVDAHKRIVNAFEKECNGEWEKLVEQEYPRLHLTAHLNGAGGYEKLRVMLTEGDERIKWAEAREKKEETYAGYLNDLTYVWDYAEREQNYALAIRCMLIENSIHSLAENIPPKLLAELAKAGIWSYARCLSTIRQKTESYDQANSLKLIATDISPSLHQEALTIACEIEDVHFRASALSALAPHLNEELRIQAISTASEIVESYYYVRALSAFMPYLSEEIKLEVLAIARDIEPESGRASALAYLVPYLNDELKMQVLHEVLATEHESINGHVRLIALSALMPYLNEDLKDQIFQKMFSLARIGTYQGEDDLAVLAPYLNEKLKAQLLSDVRTYTDKSYRVRHLSVLAPYLSEELKTKVIHEALSIAYEIQDEFDRANTLSVLIPYLTDDLKTQALHEALTGAQIANDSFGRTRALAAFTPYLSKEMKTRALSFAHEIKDKSYRVRALSILLSYFSKELKAQVLHDALSAAREISDGYERAVALSEIVPHLIDELKIQVLQEALVTAQKTRRGYYRIKVLVAIALQLTDELKTQMLQDTLTEALEIKGESDRANALSEIAPHLANELKTQALEAALTAARASNNRYTNANVISSLAPHLSEELKMRTLSAIRKMRQKTDRAYALSAFFPYLSEKLKMQVFHEALSEASELSYKRDRVRCLAILAPYLAKETQSTVLQEALYILDYSFNYSQELMDILVPWKEIKFEGMANHIVSFVKFMSRRNRNDGMEINGALTLALIHFRGPAIADELYRTIMDVTRWWK